MSVSGTLTLSNSGLPYPLRRSGGECSQIELPGVPLGSFPGVAYDEISFDLHQGDVFVFCTDGIFETLSPDGVEFGSGRLCRLVQEQGARKPREIVDAIFDAVTRFRGDRPQDDDMTAVAVTITS